MAKSDTEKSKDYREIKSVTHTRISPWFLNKLIKQIDKRRGDDSRATWVIKAAQEKLKRKG